MDKFELKQEAKSLLLKGCFKMACNKYSRLIQLGPEGFSKRQWAVVHLNQAISHQNLDQLNTALESCNRSIEIDPTYEKAYYRRIQILRQMKDLQSAIKSIPGWIHNKQIDNLLLETREEHFNSLGIDPLLEDLISGKQNDIGLIRHFHEKFYQKLLQESEKKVQPKKTKTLGQKIAKYYSQLKQKQEKESLQSFLSILHMLVVNEHYQSSMKTYVDLILQDFWTTFLQKADPFHLQQIRRESVKDNEEYKLAKFAPSCARTIHYLSQLVSHEELQSQQMFQASIQTANNLISQPFCTSFGQKIYELLGKLVSSFSTKMTHSRLNWLKRSFLLMDTLLKLHLHYEPSFKVNEVNEITLLYIRYYHINPKLLQQDFLMVPDSNIRELLLNNLNNFFVLYILEQIIHKLDRNTFKQILPAIEEELDILRDLKNTKSLSSTYLQMQKEYQLIYTSLMLKIDLKHAATKINIAALLSHKHNKQTIYDKSLSDIIINTLLLLGLNNKKNLVQILKHPHTIINIVHQYVDDSFKQQLQNLGSTISFIYLATVNIEHEQQEFYAKKMGVSSEQIEKARKLQGETQDPKLNDELMKKRQEFVQYIAKHLQETLVNLSSILLKIKEDVSLSKWSKILNEIAKIDATRLHHPKIIEIMLQSFKVQKEAVGQFFSILCKKLNTNLLKYEQIQPISNVLIYNLENGQHQLVIFQSLLSLINLTSNSNHHLKIPIKTLQNCLFQENRYIVHGALELMNNVLVQCDRQEIEKMDKIKELVQKYTNFYREQIVNFEEPIPLTDYSHPSRVYSTLLSVAIVMDLDYLQEFKDWNNAEKYLLRIKTSKEITFFKVVIYMGMKNRLIGKWWCKFQKELVNLEQSNKSYWLKLKQYMK